MAGSNYMWLADTGNGMVSKFDMRTGQELARYRSAIAISCNEGESPERNNCTGRPDVNNRTNYSPSRTAIDVYGNAWVANRGFGQLSSVTKIAMDKRLCVDRNGNNEIDTSGDFNGNNIIDPSEVLDDDECVLFTTPVCSRYNGARALAISKGQGGAGDVWVGCYDEQAAYQLNSTNGRIERGPIALGMQPYGAIVDANQNLWLTTLTSANLQGVNTTTGEVLNRNAQNNPAPITPNITGCTSYGLAVDSQNRVWVAGYGQSNIVACFYNHYAAQNKWSRCALSADGYGYGRGIAVANENAEGKSYVYMSSSSTGRLVRFSWNDADGPNGSCRIEPIAGQNTIHLGIGDSLLGVGFDREENPWVVASGNRAARVNLSDGTILRTTPAAGHNPSYYTYSDFTGYQLRNFTAPYGTYTQILEGCPSNSSWKSVSMEATIPENAHLEVYVRVADTREALSSAFRHGPFTTSPADLSEVPKSTFMQLEFVLRSDDRQSSPVLHDYEIQWACE
jgi:hypothetical protein